MTRRTSRNINSRNRGRKRRGSSSAAKILITVLSVIAIAGIGFAIKKFISDSGYKFHRIDLDNYIQKTERPVILADSAAVYLDISDGMNFAYASEDSKALLQAVINKLAANNAIRFYGLADSKIVPLEMSHTELYNFMLNPNSYNKQKAPIEKTLSQIVNANQPALLMTDFEEYKGSIIEKAAYAKKYFIDWLAKGYNITFYKWPFVENGKNKWMFLAVFDDNANRLNSLVDNAVKLTDSDIETYVLGSRDFAYPTATQYVSLKEGGNYHNENGQDIVTNVMANGSAEDYISYTKPLATSTGIPGEFAPLDYRFGVYAEYYPIGVRWEDAIKNAKLLQEKGIKPENSYSHLLSKLFINFGAQSGYSIEEVEVRTFDMQKIMEKVANEESKLPDAPEVNIFLKANMGSVERLSDEWKEIYIDFDEQFNGTFIAGVESTNLMRANVVISRVSPNIAEAIDFFSWTDNLSLANSVKETLTAESSSPQGRILYTYYLKSIVE